VDGGLLISCARRKREGVWTIKWSAPVASPSRCSIQFRREQRFLLSPSPLLSSMLRCHAFFSSVVLFPFDSFFSSVLTIPRGTYRWIFWDLSLPWQLMVTCLLFLSGFFFLFLLFSFLMVVLTPHACWFLFHRVHASCDSFLFDFFSSVLTIQFAYLDGSLGSITWETDGYLCLLFLSGTRFFFVLMV
jgi:hypothetical protein